MNRTKAIIVVSILVLDILLTLTAGIIVILWNPLIGGCMTYAIFGPIGKYIIPFLAKKK
jgi:hypothetical protein